MAKTLQRDRDFFILLFSTTKFQARALLETATPNQLTAIREIFINILHPDVELPEDVRAVLKKRVKVLKSITQTRSPAVLVAKHSRLVLDTLTHIRNIVLAQL